MNTAFHLCPGSDCNRGIVTMMVGRVIGRASNGCEVRSETFMVPSNTSCPTCKGRGRITVEIAEPVEEPATAITWHEYDAQGRDCDGERRDNPYPCRHGYPVHEDCPVCGMDEEAGAPGITYLGQPVNAPGFTQASFERAMARAFCDDLAIKPYHDGRHIVHHAGLTGGYVVTREHCDCPAGRVGTPCKHRAFLISCLDIREPHVRREWAMLNAERPSRKAAAA